MNDNNKNDLVIVDVVVMAGAEEVAANEIKVDVVVMAVDTTMETRADGEMIRWGGITVIDGL